MEIQKGSLDTHLKFRQLVRDYDFTGKRVLDVGCNLGEMCRLAVERGASFARGIDCNRQYIAEARELTPQKHIAFDVQRSEHASGNWDLVIASAVLHHAGLNLDQTLLQFSRIAPLTVCDVLLSNEPNGSKPEFHYNATRELFVPNRSAWLLVASRYFGSVLEFGGAVSPDNSYRQVFWLSQPKPNPAKAVLVYGDGGVGKTSYAKELALGESYEHLQLDQIFVEWRIVKEPSELMSVCGFVDQVWSEASPDRRRDRLHRQQIYLNYHEQYIHRWLNARVNRDVVIEGYDPKYPVYRAMLEKCFQQLGWTSPQFVHLQ